MKFKQAEFWLPNDETLVTELTSGLLRNYRTVKVERVSCPDLKEFGLGREVLPSEIGGDVILDTDSWIQEMKSSGL